jgi:hypothetical protein
MEYCIQPLIIKQKKIMENAIPVAMILENRTTEYFKYKHAP